MIKYVIFDFDGTLVDSKMSFLYIWNTIAKEYGFKGIKSEEIEDFRKLSIPEMCKRTNFPMYKLPFIIPKCYKLYKDCISKVEIINGTQDMLKSIHEKGYKTAIISSNTKENIEWFLKDNNITDITSIICSKSIFGKDKLINKFLRENNLKQCEVIYVGDEQRDIKACKKAGIKIIWVNWGFDSIELIEKENPDFKAYAPEEILDII